MKPHARYLWFNMAHENGYVSITADAARIVEVSGIRDRFVLVSTMHIMAGMYVNDAEQGLIDDIDEWLGTLAPSLPGDRHHQAGEMNRDAHSKSPLVQHENVVFTTVVGLTSGRGRGCTMRSSMAGGESGLP